MGEKMLTDFEAGIKYAGCLNTVVRKIDFILRAPSCHPLRYESITEARDSFKRTKELALEYGDSRNLTELQEIKDFCTRLGVPLDEETLECLAPFLC